jgi:hypothetical protein
MSSCHSGPSSQCPCVRVDVLQNMVYVPSQTLPDSSCANVGAQNSPAHKALAPFLPLLPEFLEGVTLAAKHEYPCAASFRRLTDLLECPRVDLHNLLDNLAEHLASSNESHAGESFVRLHIKIAPRRMSAVRINIKFMQLSGKSPYEYRVCL